MQQVMKWCRDCTQNEAKPRAQSSVVILVEQRLPLDYWPRDWRGMPVFMGPEMNFLGALGNAPSLHVSSARSSAISNGNADTGGTNN